MNKLLFSNGKSTDITLTSLSDVIATLEEERLILHKLSIDDILECFDTFASHLLSDNKLLSSMPYSKALAQFIQTDSLRSVLNESLRGDYHILDRFIDKEGVLYRCQPRGLVVHWLAGNAPLLGFYSLVLSLLTKNVSIIKLPSRAYHEFMALFAVMGEEFESSVVGQQLLRSVAVILLDRDNKKLHQELSLAASVRIAWGGKDAIQAISALSKNLYAEDILLGPKYSLGVIDKTSLADYKDIAGKLALDIATFDQYACSSPHTIFVEKSDKVSAEDFAQELARALEIVGKKLIRKIPPDPKKNMDILNIRAKYSMTGTIISSKDTEWTVIVTGEEGLAPACASRVIFIKKVESIRDVIPFITRRNQTLGMAIVSNQEFLDELTQKGIDRCVPFGKMTFFDSPWDGMFIADRLVRWVVCRK